MTGLRLTCDRMLLRVARWLRAAGHDVETVGAREPDIEALARARLAGRVFVTCDRRLVAEHAPRAEDVILLRSGQPERAAVELNARLGVNWLAAPFTRCLIDNARLRPATDTQLLLRPVTAWADTEPVLACPRCGRVYWAGSHVRRIRERLQHLQHAGPGRQAPGESPGDACLP